VKGSSIRKQSWLTWLPWLSFLSSIVSLSLAALAGGGFMSGVFFAVGILGVLNGATILAYRRARRSMTSGPERDERPDGRNEDE
jgi:hypothetical protein